MKNFTRPLLLLLFSMFFFEAKSQKKVYVDASNANKVASTLDGTTWAKAYASLEVAITKNLITDNVEYYIAEGTYTFSNNSFYYTNASFFGGYKTGGSDTPDRQKYFTKVEKANLSFELKKNGKQYVTNIIFGISELDVVSTRVFRGNGGQESMQSKFGLPIEFSNCLFLGCKFNSNIGNVSLLNNEFRQCFTTSISAGDQKVSNCIFKDGFSNGLSVGSSNAKIENCTFENNTGTGLFVYFGSDGTLNNLLKTVEILKTNLEINSGDGILIMGQGGVKGNIIISEVKALKNKRNGLSLQNDIAFKINDLICNDNLLNGIDLFVVKTTTNIADIINKIECNNNKGSGINALYHSGTYGTEGFGAWNLEIKNGKFISDSIGININISTDFRARSLSILDLKLDSLSVALNKVDGIRVFNGIFACKMNVVKINDNVRNGFYTQSVYNVAAKNCEIGNNGYFGVQLTGSGAKKLGTFSIFEISNSSIFGSNIGLWANSGENEEIITIDKCKIFNNTFSKNLFGLPSTGIYFIGRSLSITNSEIYGNKAKGETSGLFGNGGALFSDGSFGISSIGILNSFFYDNSSTGAGGAIYAINTNLGIYNTVFTQNTASNQGGAVISSGNPARDSEIINCTFFDNKTYDLEGGGAISNNSTKAINIKNSIFYKNKQNKANNIFSSDIYAKTGPLNINRTVLQLDSLIYKTTPNINFSGVGNYYNKDPKFLLPAYLEDSAKAYLRGADNLFGTKDDALRLRSDSPFLNVGVNNYIAGVNPTGLDVAGNERIQEFVIDLGAYEGGVKVIHSIPLPTEKVIAEGSSATITLATLTDYGNPVTYTLVSGPATLKDNVLTPTGKPGKILVTGKANGTEKDVTISICVNPSKPTITLRDVEGDFFLKSSTTTGNIWYNNDKKTTLTTQEIMATYDSFYTLQIDVESCVSVFSDKIVIPKDKIHTIGTITLTDLKEGNEKTIDLPTKTDFGNTVNYTITGPGTITNGKLTVGGKPGLVQIVGKANKATKDVNYKFCVIPNTPTITLINNNGIYAIKSSSADGNIWFKNDTKIAITAQEISADYEATYKLQIDLSGCLSELSEKITIPKLIILGIENGSDDDIILYPNPLNNELTIKAQNRLTQLLVKIIDTNGRMILSEKHSSTGNDIKLDMKNFASGTYLIELETNKVKIIKKIIKQ